MPKLPITTGAKVIKALSHFGWKFERQKGSHAILVKEKRGSVPVPIGKIHKGLLGAIIKETKVDVKEFLKYLMLLLLRKR